MEGLTGRRTLLLCCILILFIVAEAGRGRPRHIHCPHFRPGGPYPGLHWPLIPCTSDDECRPHECCCDFEGHDYCLPEEIGNAGAVSASSSDCPDFTKVPPPSNITTRTCVSEADCGYDEECCPYQGNYYCVQEKDEHGSHHGDKDDDDCHEYDDDEDEKHGHKEKRGKKCHGHIRKAVFIAFVGVGILATIIVASLCIMKKCCEKKRKINDSMVNMRSEKKPCGRGMDYRVPMPSEPTTQSMKEKEALEGWAQRVLAPPSESAIPPPMYSPTAPPAYTSSPPPSYHI